MGWDQSYHLPSEIELLEKITGCKAVDLLQQEMDRKGIKIIKEMPTTLVDDPYNGEVIGKYVELSDGRIMEMRLVETFRSDDSGTDIFGWCELREETAVKKHREE